MRIEVVIAGWEQACCGAPFRLGDQATWKLLATDPAAEPISTVARFKEEHHDQTPPDVPHRDVSGTVVTMCGINYPRIPTPGLPGAFAWDTSNPTSQSLVSAGKHSEVGFDEYLVILDVHDDIVLPEFSLSAQSIPQRERDARTAERKRARRGDEVGVLLEALADDAQRSYTDVARVTRATDSSAMTIEPHYVGAATIRWARGDAEDSDGITVHVGDGTWHFPASVTHAAVVRTFLDAAAAGRVEEHVRTHNASPQLLETVVLAEDGRSWTATDSFEPFKSDDGVFAVAGPLWRRVQRGDHRYNSWNLGNSG